MRLFVLHDCAQPYYTCFLVLQPPHLDTNSDFDIVFYQTMLIHIQWAFIGWLRAVAVLD